MCSGYGTGRDIFISSSSISTAHEKCFQKWNISITHEYRKKGDLQGFTGKKGGTYLRLSIKWQKLLIIKRSRKKKKKKRAFIAAAPLIWKSTTATKRHKFRSDF